MPLLSNRLRVSSRLPPAIFSSSASTNCLSPNITSPPQWLVPPSAVSRSQPCCGSHYGATPSSLSQSLSPSATGALPRTWDPPQRYEFSKTPNLPFLGKFLKPEHVNDLMKAGPAETSRIFDIVFSACVWDTVRSAIVLLWSNAFFTSMSTLTSLSRHVRSTSDVRACQEAFGRWFQQESLNSVMFIGCSTVVAGELLTMLKT